MHGTPTAAQIWGISQDEYLDKADAWPLNPNGELLLGVKLEDKYALANAEENLKVPGIGICRVGTRRHGFVAWDSWSGQRGGEGSEDGRGSSQSVR